MPRLERHRTENVGGRRKKRKREKKESEGRTPRKYTAERKNMHNF